MAAAATARRVARYVYLGLIILFLAGVLVQALLAGRFIFAAADPTPHVELGWPLAHMLAPVVFLLSLFLKGGRAFWITSILWFVSAVVQPIFAALGAEGPNDLAALHVVNALVLFSLTLWLADRAWHLAMQRPRPPPVRNVVPSRPSVQPARPRAPSPPTPPQGRRP